LTNSFLTVPNEKLAAYGPHSSANREVLLFTVANDFEAHGQAMPPDIDSRNIKALVHMACQRTGATFAAHLPFSTDSVGEIARNWSPQYMPFNAFVEGLIATAKPWIESFSFRPRKVLMVIGHGGNRLLPTRDDEISKQLGVQTESFMPGVLRPIPGLESFEAAEFVIENFAAGGEHAYHVEHSMAAHFGDVDFDKLAEMNRVAADDPLDALRRWPAIAGLGGYIEFGGKEFDPLREIAGLVMCLDDFKRRRKIIADAKFGGDIVEVAVEFIVDKIVSSP